MHSRAFLIHKYSITYKNLKHVNYGYFKPTNLSWTTFDLGYKPKYLAIYARALDTDFKTIAAELDMLYMPDIKLLDPRYACITDNGFMYSAYQSGFIRGYMCWFAATDE